MTKRTKVIVRYRTEGFHNWPEAPDHRDYLRFRHRHIFHVEVQVEVSTHDRQIEFHTLRDFCLAKFHGGELGSQSCEDIADALSEVIREYWRVKFCSVSVFEDGECGGNVTVWN